ncbi:BMC domain-containing protein [Aminipila butyrica]|uniref:BMC domain-containing protein n=1 Tax=Aminipila butyrica TaxID=433296 RepID=A0A858BTB8_9FIRM|nr:BMC domain-containing protein [Aminipila butyrica]QIB69173.1 BMC domain-containing protein [Aminipila butyrica]
METEKQRVIQEYVPGKQVTLAHIIAKPTDELYEKLGLVELSGSVGVLTITPSEAAIIAGDLATKAADIRIGFIDRFNGSLFIAGNITAVESALKNILVLLCDKMGYARTEITRT